VFATYLLIWLGTTASSCCSGTLTHHRALDHLSTTVYLKPTHTDQYIPFNSHYHPRVLAGGMDAWETEHTALATVKTTDGRKWNPMIGFCKPMDSRAS